MTWPAFCLALSESLAVRNAWQVAQDIRAGGKQPFKVRSGVESHNDLGVQLEKKYLGLTEKEFLEKFKCLQRIGHW